VYTRIPATQRFWNKVKFQKSPANCWLWTRCVGPQGYGIFTIQRHQNIRAHVFAYQEFFGPVPEGYGIHHKCQNKLCVNPKHLELLTKSEHTKIHWTKSPGLLGAAAQRAKTHCPHGHPYNNENLYIRKTGSRTCRICQKLSDKKSYAKRRIIFLAKTSR
jgi:hypothetical protein